MMGGFGGGGMFFGGLIMLAFWVVIIGGAAWLVWGLVRGGQFSLGAGKANEKPLEILRARYAKGEITKAQFDQMRRDLGI